MAIVSTAQIIQTIINISFKYASDVQISLKSSWPQLGYNKSI